MDDIKDRKMQFYNISEGITTSISEVNFMADQEPQSIRAFLVDGETLDELGALYVNRPFLGNQIHNVFYRINGQVWIPKRCERRDGGSLTIFVRPGSIEIENA